MKKRFILLVLIMFTVFSSCKIVHAETAIHLKIITSDNVLYDEDITVAPCDSDNAGTMDITPYCAIQQSGLASEWDWYGTDAFLSSIDSVENNSEDNGIYWGWFANLELGETALNKYTLVSGDSILLNYGINPLLISVDNENPSVGDTVNFVVTQFEYDSSWNPTWAPADGGKIVIGIDNFDLDEEGSYSYVIANTDIFTAYGQQDGFINSPEITITPEEDETPKPRRSSGSSKTISQELPKLAFDTEKAFQFLISNQKENGSFGEILYTDWTALALASGNYQATAIKLIKYFEETKIESDMLTDYERHAMALMSLGLNPYNANGENYIEKIIFEYDGEQFGDKDQYNDDIFALIVLQNAGYEKSEEMISNDISFILRHQMENGSWGESVDMTGAAIEALSLYQENEKVKISLEKAIKFLKDNQGVSGGWNNNASSTAWALEGIFALGEESNVDWLQNGNSPFDFLATLQDTDGGIRNDNLEIKIWETAYTLSALSGNTWNETMQKFAREETKTPTVQTKKAFNNLPKEVKKIEKPEENLSAIVIESIPLEIAPSIIEIETPKRNWFARFLGIIFGVF